MVAHGFELWDGFGAGFGGVESGEVVASGIDYVVSVVAIWRMAVRMARWTATFALSGPPRLAICRYWRQVGAAGYS